MAVRHKIAILLAGAALAFPAGAAASCPSGTLGVYTGAAKPERVQAFGSSLGHPVAGVLDFLPRTNWRTLRTPNLWTRAWGHSKREIVLSVPMLTGGDGSFEPGREASYDRHFRRLGRRLVAGGLGDAVLRIGWEANADFFGWSSTAHPARYAAYWRHIVRSLRGAKGERFRFDWTMAIGPGTSEPGPAYPGDRYVDYIGLDVYDQYFDDALADPALRWQDFVVRPHGLAWHAAFAEIHGKPMSYPEWGLALRSDGNGGGDNPYFIEAMHDWIEANDVAYHHYFDYDTDQIRSRISDGQFPQAAIRFRELFGAKPLTDWRTCQLGL